MVLLVFDVSCISFFFFKQKTAYEMRISDWSSDVCSSDLDRRDLTATSGHGIWNARLSASDIRAGAGGSFEVSLWGRNLADKEYDAAAVDNLQQADRAVVWGAPRSFGVDLTYHYR